MNTVENERSTNSKGLLRVGDGTTIAGFLFIETTQSHDSKSEESFITER